MDKKKHPNKNFHKHGLPLSYFTNRLSILFVIIFFATSFYESIKNNVDIEKITMLFFATSGSILLLIIIIASPNKHIDWIDKIINHRTKK